MGFATELRFSRDERRKISAQETERKRYARARGAESSRNEEKNNRRLEGCDRLAVEADVEEKRMVEKKLR